MKRRKIANSRIVEVYRKKACNVSATCNALKVDRSTFYKWRDEDASLRQMLDDADEALVDNVESKLLAAINDGNMTAIIFFLKCKAKERGYVDRTEHDITINAFEKLMQEIPDE